MEVSIHPATMLFEFKQTELRWEIVYIFANAKSRINIVMEMGVRILHASAIAEVNFSLLYVIK